MAVENDMLWLGSLESLNERTKAQYVVVRERFDKEYRGTLDDAMAEFRDSLNRAHHAGVVYFCIKKHEDVWYVKGYPVRKTQ